MTSGPWTGTSAICESGHVIAFRISDPTWEVRVEKFCSDCGGLVMTRCRACGYHLAVTDKWDEFQMPLPVKARDYCAGCGTPHPWISRTGAIDGLILMVRRDVSIETANKLAAIEKLEALKLAGAGSDDESKLWSSVKQHAGPVWEATGGKAILAIVLPTALRYLL